MSNQRAFMVLAAVLSLFGIAPGQIIDFRQIGDKMVTCTHSGLTSALKDCGVRSDWYEYVFVGSISAVRSIHDEEKEIQITPQEVFGGKPANPFIIQTSQAPCVPEVASGTSGFSFCGKKQVSGSFLIITEMTAVLSPRHKRKLRRSVASKRLEILRLCEVAS